MFARIATFEGGDAERLRQLNEERMSSGTMNAPSGVRRAMVLQGPRRLFVTFFDTREELEAAEKRFAEMGDEIPEEIRGKRVGVDVYEVVFDGEL
jgi:HAMP domain-containing protein